MTEGKVWKDEDIISIATFDYSINVRVDETSIETFTIKSPSYNLKHAKIELKNDAFDLSTMRIENVVVKNRREFSLCNVKDNLLVMDEIEIQNCTLSKSCYETFDRYDKFDFCQQNIEWSLPPEIQNEEEKILANKIQWISYCDYAWPEAVLDNIHDNIGIHSGNWDEMCPTIDEAFPILDCENGVLLAAMSLTGLPLGTSPKPEGCKDLLDILFSQNQYPTIIEWDQLTTQCIAKFDSESISQILTPSPTQKTCFIYYGGIPNYKISSEIYSVPDCTNYPTNDLFYRQCFKKTEPYALACSNACLQRLREEVNATDCKKEADMKNIGRLVGKECRGDACQQELTNFVSKQFCAYQNQYHNIVPWEITYGHEIYIPELEKAPVQNNAKPTWKMLLLIMIGNHGV